jgi:hypothetical protein
VTTPAVLESLSFAPTLRHFRERRDGRTHPQGVQERRLVFRDHQEQVLEARKGYPLLPLWKPGPGLRTTYPTKEQAR